MIVAGLIAVVNSNRISSGESQTYIHRWTTITDTGLRIGELRSGDDTYGITFSSVQVEVGR